MRRIPLVLALAPAAALLLLAGCGKESPTASSAATSQAPDAPRLAGANLHVVQANQFTMSAQEHATLDVDPAGRFVVAWESRRQEEGTYGIYARLFSPAGEPLSAEVRINETVQGMQQEPALACGPDGETWLAWSSFGQDGQGRGVLLRRLEPGLASGTHEVPVNETTLGDQSAPVLSVNLRGRVLVVWSTADASSQPRLRARLFDSAGEPLTGELVVGTAGESAPVMERAPAVTTLGDGRFVIAFTRTPVDGSASQVVLQEFSPDGAPGCCEVVASPEDGRDHFEPSIAADARGNLSVAWLTSGESGPHASVRWFNSEGHVLTDAVTLGEGSFVSAVGVSMDPSGRTAVALTRDDRGAEDVLVTTFAAPAAPDEQNIAMHASADGRQWLTPARGVTRCVLTRDGRLAAAWAGVAPEGDSSGVYLAVRVPEGSLLAAPALAQVAGPAEPVASGASGAPAPEAAQPSHIPPTFNQEDILPPERWPVDGAAGADFGFEGVPSTGWTPPDPEIAVGPNHLVVVTNGQIAFFDKNGTNLFRDQIENTFGFWGELSPGNFVFDPECLFDPHSQRFMAMACERTGGRSYFLFAVSDDDNPVGTWHKYRFDVTGLAGGDIDSPQLAVDENAVYLAADFFEPQDKYLVYIFDKDSVLRGDQPAVTRSLLVNGRQSFGQPIMYDADNFPAYMIESTENRGGDNTVLVLHAILDPLGSPSVQSFTLPVATYRFPGQPPQRGTGTRPFLFEPRFWSAQYIGGSIWATHHVTTPQSQTIRMRWYQIDMNGWPVSGQTPTLRQSGDVFPGEGIHTYFGSIAADEAGNAALTFARSSVNEYISMSRAARLASDAPGTMSPSQLVKESSAPYGVTRWGDYSGTKFDPAQPGAFWGHHEWTPNGVWRTWIARYELVAPCPVDFDQNGTLDGQDFLTFLNFFFARNELADLDGNGAIDGGDFLQFLALFFQGC